jgi:hypothetical protein
MPTLMPELARERADSNRKIAAIAEAARLRREGAPAARKLTRLAIARGPDAREQWQEVTEALRGGLSGETATEVVGVTLEVADTWLEMARVARQLCVEAGAGPEGLEQLDEVEKEVRQVRTEAERTQAFLTRPRPPIDAERLEKGRRDIAEGRFKTAEEIGASRTGQGG